MLFKLMLLVGIATLANSMPHNLVKRDAQIFPVTIRVLDDRPYKYGRLTNVECLVINDQDEYEMSWSRQGAMNRGHVTHKSHNKIMMEIRNMIPMDFGKYTCSAMRLSDGVIVTNTITFRRDVDSASGFDFDVEYSMAPPETNTEPQQPQEIKQNTMAIGNINNDRTIRILEEFQTYTHEGETVKFTCEVEGIADDEITWEKNMAQLPANHEIKGNVLILNNVRPEDTGYYICAHGKKSDSVFLGIANKDDPITIVRIKSDKKLVNTVEGDDVNLVCNVVGQLPTEIRWAKHLTDNLPSYSELLKQDSSQTLVLRQIQKEDFGYYECFGENELGTFSDFVYVDIEENQEAVDANPIENENAVVDEDENDTEEEPVENDVEEENDNEKNEEESGEVEEAVDENKNEEVLFIVAEDTTEYKGEEEGQTNSAELNDVTAEVELYNVTEEPIVEEKEPVEEEPVEEEPLEEEPVEEEPLEEEPVEEEPVEEEAVEEEPLEEEPVEEEAVEEEAVEKKPVEEEPEVVNYGDDDNENDGDLL